MQFEASKKFNRKTSALSNIAAIIIVVVIIAAAGIGAYGMYGQGHGKGTSTNTGSSASSSNHSSLTSSVQSSESSSIHSSVTSSVQSSASSSVQSSTGTGSHYGQLSILVSDPPHLPANASALFITFPNMFVHITGLPDGDGWIQVASSGTIQLLGAVDIGQTVASASIPAGEYNLIRFNVSSAVVAYNGQNYTALVQNGNLTVHFISSLTVDPSQPSALVVDIQPFVYNFGTSTDPFFVLKTAALSFVVPAGSVTLQMHQMGNMYQFQANNTWFWQYRNTYYPNINITIAALSGSSLSVTIANPSNQTATINAITVTALQATSGGYGNGSGQGQGYGYGMGYGASASTPDGMSGSAAFLILPNGTLTQLSRIQYSGTPLNLSSLIWGNSGYVLLTGASVTLSYSGSILLSLRMSPNVQAGAIVSGQQYLVSIVGDGVCGNYAVNAS